MKQTLAMWTANLFMFFFFCCLRLDDEFALGTLTEVLARQRQEREWKAIKAAR